MKRVRLFLVILIFVHALLMVGCAPSAEQIKRAIAQTQTAVPYPTQTSYPTQTAYSTQTVYPTATYVPIITPEFKPLTWADLVDFILNDHINWHTYSDEYNCVNFSIDLVANALKLRIDAWIVAVTFVAQDKGHAFVAFPTTNRGIIWIEPQSDDAYVMAYAGEQLCLADNPGLCWDQGIIESIIQPATCDPVSHECW